MSLILVLMVEGTRLPDFCSIVGVHCGMKQNQAMHLFHVCCPALRKVFLMITQKNGKNPELPSKLLKRFSHVQHSITHLYISLLFNFLKTCKCLTLTEWWYTKLTLMWATQKSIYTTLLNNEKFFWKEVCGIPLFQMMNEILAFRSNVLQIRMHH